MHKFIKFISPGQMNIINSDDLLLLQFIKEELIITFTFRSSDLPATFKYKLQEDYKQQCDAIMEQLEI